MHAIRFRLKTIMIVIAILAVLLAIIPGFTLIRFIRETSVRIEGSSVWIRIDPMPGELVRNDSGTVVFIHDIYVQIPLMIIAIFLGIVIFVVLAVYFRPRRRSRAGTPPGGPGSTAST
jgi:hypothetical protein